MPEHPATFNLNFWPCYKAIPKQWVFRTKKLWFGCSHYLNTHLTPNNLGDQGGELFDV